MNKSEYDMRYMRENVTRKLIPFNKSKDDDAKLLAWLETKKNVTQYIKNLIWRDMNKQG